MLSPTDEIIGYRGLPTGIITSSVTVGTEAGDQFPAVFQSVSEAPVHVLPDGGVVVVKVETLLQT